MTKIYLCLLSASLLSSCTPTISYLGNTYQPTKDVDVYVDESAISKEYTIMGKGYVESLIGTISEKIQKKAINKAKQKGADAVLFKDYFVPATQSQTRTRKDSSGGITVSINNPTPVQSASPEVIVFFLKYK
ncbi:MAG TPA: hypothetical protein VGN63_09220 [Flavisolibacter sp.]|jgi:hypothetical protein|nr:hypothetical protein [Flavisolibacter sp.]